MINSGLKRSVTERLWPIDQEAAAQSGKIVARIGKPSPKLLVPSPTGKKWARRNFSRVWDQVMARIGRAAARQLFREGFSKEEVKEQLAENHR